MTVMARLRSLIRPSLISPRTTINWSPDHWILSCDYAQDHTYQLVHSVIDAAVEQGLGASGATAAFDEIELLVTSGTAHSKHTSVTKCNGN